MFGTKPFFFSIQTTISSLEVLMFSHRHRRVEICAQRSMSPIDKVKCPHYIKSLWSVSVPRTRCERLFPNFFLPSRNNFFVSLYPFSVQYGLRRGREPMFTHTCVRTEHGLNTKIYPEGPGRPYFFSSPGCMQEYSE